MYAKKKILKGCTRVELGVQAIDDKIYKKVKRGHTVMDVVNATTRLRNSGFKIGYHIMPGIPGSNKKKDIRMFKKIFKDENFKPEQLKIYPCQVIKGAKLEKDYYDRKYHPYTEKETKELLIKFLHLTPRYCRIMRVMREIPPDYLIAGTTRIDLRKEIEAEFLFLEKKESSKEKNYNRIKEIRFREIGLRSRYQQINTENIKLKITTYKASKGDEYFLEIINKNDILFALCRLRIFDKQALVRELHVYGQATNLGKRGKVQHSGLGKQLIKKTEKITKSNKIPKLKIISGVGVRQYYKKLGYKLDKQGIYMEKEL